MVVLHGFAKADGQDRAKRYNICGHMSAAAVSVDLPRDPPNNPRMMTRMREPASGGAPAEAA